MSTPGGFLDILHWLHGDGLKTLIQTVGYFGVWAIVFAESGLLFGFFLPGDSLLFTAGFLASPAIHATAGQEVLNVWVLVIGCFIAAVAGDSVGYWTGNKLGRGLFMRPDSRFFRKKDLERAEAFFDKHGGKSLILARFIPIVRTFVPIVAGVSAMPYSKFFSYNVIGGFLWTFGMIWGGYFLGAVIPDPDKYLLPIIAAIIVISILPTVVHLWKDRHELLGRKPKVESTPIADANVSQSESGLRW